MALKGNLNVSKLRLNRLCLLRLINFINKKKFKSLIENNSSLIASHNCQLKFKYTKDKLFDPSTK